MTSLPLRDLFKSNTPDQVTHEIILVHGFKSCLGSKSRSVECRRILESWVLDEIKSINNRVNVRTFSFDSEHILHNGRSALHEYALELSNSLEATSDSSSPLFCSLANGDRGRSSRAAIFVAHGIGMWVVKELLTIIRTQENRIDPTGLFFFDIPEALVAPNPIVNISSRPVISQYLHEFSKIFKMEIDKRPTVKQFAKQIKGLLKGCRIETPVQKLHKLGLWGELYAATSSRGFHDPQQELPSQVLKTLGKIPDVPQYPKESEPINDSKSPTKLTNDSTSTTKNGNLTDASTPSNKPSCTSKEGDSAGVEKTPCGCPKKKDTANASTPSGESTEIATCSSEEDGLKDASTALDNSCCSKKGDSAKVDEVPTCHKSDTANANANTTPSNPTTCTEKGEPTDTDKPSSEMVWRVRIHPTPAVGRRKEKEKEHIINLRRKSLPPAKMSDISQGERDATSSYVTDSIGLDEEFKFENIIAQRNNAAAQDDNDELHSAIQKLEILKFHQTLSLENDDPKILITQKEIVKTSIEYGWWDGAIMEIWEESHLLEMEEKVFKAYDGLRRSLGPHHPETMDTLALLFALGIPGLAVDKCPIADIQAIYDMITKKLVLVQDDDKKPGRLMRALETEYKAAHRRLAELSGAIESS
ncbi:hypothetical protein F4805DRAFT_455318 [Annulohypoxylon moriforme]|nr:hypothetical protein F4805DRAFT_455318 [Annulohypoxylon moriforme]